MKPAEDSRLRDKKIINLVLANNGTITVLVKNQKIRLWPKIKLLLILDRKELISFLVEI